MFIGGDNSQPPPNQTWHKFDFATCTFASHYDVKFRQAQFDFQSVWRKLIADANQACARASERHTFPGWVSPTLIGFGFITFVAGGVLMMTTQMPYLIPFGFLMFTAGAFLGVYAQKSKMKALSECGRAAATVVDACQQQYEPQLTASGMQLSLQYDTVTHLSSSSSSHHHRTHLRTYNQQVPKIVCDFFTPGERPPAMAAPMSYPPPQPQGSYPPPQPHGQSSHYAPPSHNPALQYGGNGAGYAVPVPVGSTAPPAYNDAVGGASGEGSRQCGNCQHFCGAADPFCSKCGTKLIA